MRMTSAKTTATASSRSARAAKPSPPRERSRVERSGTQRAMIEAAAAHAPAAAAARPAPSLKRPAMTATPPATSGMATGSSSVRGGIDRPNVSDQLAHARDLSAQVLGSLLLLLHLLRGRLGQEIGIGQLGFDAV